MEKVIIKKVMSIGSNCFGADFTNMLGIREKGPVDNIANFYIWKSSLLFSRQFKKLVFHSKYNVENSSEKEIEEYHFYKKKFIFPNEVMIVHNNFRSLKYRFSMKRRIRKFRKFYKKSLKNNYLWYIYSLDKNDEYLTESRIVQIRNSLPECCYKRLIVLGIRAHNSLFERFFKYYVEIENEDDYVWKNKEQAYFIAKLLNDKYGITFHNSTMR